MDQEHPQLADVTAQVKAPTREKTSDFLNSVLWILAAIAIVAAIYFNASTMRFMGTVYNFDIFEPWEKSPIPEGITEEERLLLTDSELEGKRQLHRLVPANPAYFAEYASAYVSKMSPFPEMEPLPPDFLETSAQIAPGNAFFPYFAAAAIGHESFTKKTFKGPTPPDRYVEGVRLRPLLREMEYDITDPAAFEEAMGMVAKAASLPSFEIYSNRMMVARMRLLPDDTLAEFTESLMQAYGAEAGLIRIRNVADLLCARAEQLSKSGDKEQFVILAEQRDAFLSHLGHNPDMTLVGELVYSVIATGTVTNFQFAAERLGLTEMAETYRKQSDEFQQERDLREIRREKEEGTFPEERVSLLAHMSLPMLEHQVLGRLPIKDAEFEPMRMAEHELLTGMGVLSIAVLLPIVAVLVFLFRFVITPMICIPAKRMAGVLGAVDWLWVVALGVVAPILLFLLVTRLDSLNGREYGAAHFLLMFPGVHLVALLFYLLIAPATLVRWRLTRRLAPLQLSDRFTIPISIAALVMIGFWSLVALPILVRFGVEKLVLRALAAPLIFCLFLIFCNALRVILGSPAARIAQALTTLTVLPCYPIAIIALCAIMPIYSAGEKSWLAKETLLRVDLDAPDFGAYEFKVAAQKRKEINAILGLE